MCTVSVRSVVSLFFGQLTSGQGSIWRIISYIAIFYIAITANTANLYTTTTTTTTIHTHSQQQLQQQQQQQQQQAQLETQIQLGVRVVELENNLLKCSEAKTLYRKEWGKVHCKQYGTGPRGGYCVSRDVSADNEILSVPVADGVLSLIGSSATVYDFGCGIGQYGKYWTTHSKNITWTGFDGAEGIEEKTDNWVKFLDLTEPAYMPRRDWSISLEVGEHIPQAYQDIFIDNLHRHNTKGIILTWGIPGQGGTNHINLHENSWVIAKMDALGYDYMEQESKQTRKQVQDTKIHTWFTNTFMAFKRRVPPAV